jgi:single-strand DNA-binding protein
MAGVNRWYGIGNMTRDPELKQGEQERSDRCEFSIAINRPGQDSEPTFLDLVAWDKLARQVNEWGRKGRLVYCEGEIEVRKWEDRETGEKKRMYRIKAWVVRFLDRRDEETEQRDDEPPRRQPTSRAEDFSDLPW